MAFSQLNFSYSIMIFLCISCSSAQMLQEKPPIEWEDVYYQQWISGVKGGGSGLDVYISFSNSIPDKMQLDSVYFRGKASKLEVIKGAKVVYVGRFKTDFNKKHDLVMSSDPTKEYGNQLSTSSIPFKLKEDECIVSFKVENQTKYFKIKDMVEKPAKHYPSVPPNKE